MSASDRRTAEPDEAPAATDEPPLTPAPIATTDDASTDGAMTDGAATDGDVDNGASSNGRTSTRRTVTAGRSTPDAATVTTNPDTATGDDAPPAHHSLLASTLVRELRGRPADVDTIDDIDDIDDAQDTAEARTTTTIPEIVPATVDVPEEPSARETVPVVVRPAPILDGDDPDEWTEMPESAVVRVPREGRTMPLRPVGRRPRVRKVTRVVRHVDPWSTFKVALIFSAVLYTVLLTAGVLLWNVAVNTGTVDNVERWFTQFGWETFELDGGEIFHNAWIAGLFAMLGLTAFAVLSATLFNLVSDIVGGVRLTVLEEEVVERTISSSRRFVVRRAPSPAVWDPEAVEDPGT